MERVDIDHVRKVGKGEIVPGFQHIEEAKPEQEAAVLESTLTDAVDVEERVASGDSLVPTTADDIGNSRLDSAKSKLIFKVWCLGNPPGNSPFLG